MIFTVEETSLINSLGRSSRNAALLDIVGQLPNIKDEELKRLCRETAGKLYAMSDDEFTGLDFTIDDGEV